MIATTMQGLSSPLVERTKQRLLQEFSTGRFDPNNPLPTHRQWAKQFRVSHFIVGRAMEQLKQDGIIEARQGSYTFLRKVPAEEVRAPAESVIPEKTRVSLWTLEQHGLRKIRQTIVRQRFQTQFCKAYPSIETREQLIEGSPADFHARLLANVVSGPEPSVARTERTSLPFLLAQGAVAPIDMAACESYLAKLHPRYLRACSRDGRLELLPMEVSYSLLLFNESLLRSVGVDTKQPPKDWEEFADACRKIRAANGGKPSFHLAGISGLVWWLMQLTYQCLAELDSDSLPAVDWNSPAARKAVRFFLDLYSENLIHVHTDDFSSLGSLVLADEAAFFLDTGSMASQVALLGEGERFGIAPLPAGPNGKSLSQLNCIGWFINGHAEPAQQRASSLYALAWERWLHEGEGGQEMERLGVNGSLFSMFAEPDSDRYGTRDYPFKWRHALKEVEAHGVWEPADADAKKIALGQSLLPLLKKGQPPIVEQVLQQMRLCEFENGFHDGAVRKKSKDAVSEDR